MDRHFSSALIPLIADASDMEVKKNTKMTGIVGAFVYSNAAEGADEGEPAFEALRAIRGILIPAEFDSIDAYMEGMDKDYTPTRKNNIKIIIIIIIIKLILCFASKDPLFVRE